MSSSGGVVPSPSPRSQQRERSSPRPRTEKTRKTPASGSRDREPWIANLAILKSANLAIGQSFNAENLRKSARFAGARSRLDRGQFLQQNTQRAALGEIYTHPQLLHRPASKNFRNGRRRSRQLRRNFRKIFEILSNFKNVS